MKQQRTLEEISDGKIYDISDKVKADTRGCDGCSACCHGVGDLVMLTPFDIFEIVRAAGQDFEALMEDKMTWREEKKVLLPYLKMQEGTEKCSFLNDKGRCTIHSSRPNICRLFPLGRVYQGNDFKYFLQVNNCKKPQLEEVTVSEWIGISDYENNKAFLLAWHELVKALQFRMKFVYDEEMIKDLNELMHKNFYGELSKITGDFYEAFFMMLPKVKKQLGII